MAQQQQLQHPLLPHDHAEDDVALLSDEAPPSSSCCGCWSAFLRFRRSGGAVVLVVSFALFVDLLVYAIIIPVLPLFVRTHLGGSSSAIGLLFACYAAGLLAFTPLFAVWSDRMASRRLPMLIGLGCLAASTLLFGFASELWQLALARVAQGASAAATNTLGLAMVADVYSPRELSVQMGIIMAANGLGGLVGPPLGGALFDHVSFVSIFLVTGGCAILDLIMRIVLIDDGWIREQRKVITRQVEREAEEEEAQDAALSEQVEEAKQAAPLPDVVISPSTTLLIVEPSSDDVTASAGPVVHRAPRAKLGLVGMLRVPRLMVSQVGVLVFALVFTALEPLLALHFDDAFKSSSAAIGYSYFAVAIPYMLSSILVGIAADAGVRAKYLVAGGFACMAVALGCFALPKTLFVELAPMIGFGIGVGLASTPPLSEIAHYLTDTKNTASFAQGYALFNLSFSGGMFLGPVISGQLYNYTSFMVTVLTLSGAAAATATLLFVVGAFEAKTERRENESKRINPSTPLPRSGKISPDATALND